MAKSFLDQARDLLTSAVTRGSKFIAKNPTPIGYANKQFQQRVAQPITQRASNTPVVPFLPQVTPKSYVQGQVINPIRQGVQKALNPRESAFNRGIGAGQAVGGVISATPGGALFNIGQGVLTGASQALRQRQNPQLTIGKSINEPTSFATTGLGIQNPAIALGVDLLSPSAAGKVGSALKVKGMVAKEQEIMNTARTLSEKIKTLRASGASEASLSKYQKNLDVLLEKAQQMRSTGLTMGIKGKDVTKGRVSDVPQGAMGIVSSRTPKTATQTVKTPTQISQSIVSKSQTNLNPEQGLGGKPSVGGGVGDSIQAPQAKIPSALSGGSSNAIISQGKYSYNINLDKLDLSKEERAVLDKVITQIKPELQSAKGKTLTNKEVIQAAKESQILTQVTSREQTEVATAAMLKARQRMTELDKELTESLKSGNAQVAQAKMRELVESLRVVSSNAADTGRKLQALAIEAGEETVRSKILKDVSKIETNTQKILDEAGKVDWNNANSITTFYRKFIKPSTMEILDEFRYNNMLSNPRTHIRNAYSNLVQTVFTRPATLAAQGKPLEAMKYYGGVVKNVPEAIDEFVKSFKGVKGLEKPDLRYMPTQKIPKILTWPTRALEAGDKFFQTLIKGGELSRGATEAQATQIAQYSLFRQGLKPKDQGTVLNAIDNATEAIYQFGKKVPVMRWFVPFVQTPMNFAKQWIEYSPAGVATAIGAGNKREQIGKAFLGSAVMMTGAKMALDGRTTWSAPTDPKEKEAFYASGRKPFSIKVGDKWVSMMYAGPFAYAIALPAAMQYYNKDARTALTDDGLAKAGRITASMAEYLSGQTFLEGMGNFVKLASGDADYSFMKNLGFTAGQLIPQNGLVNYITKALDPVYRKTNGFVEQIQSGLPGLSQKLPAFTTPEGTPSTREKINLVTPFDVSTEVARYNPVLKSRGSQLQINSIFNQGDAIEEQANDLIKRGDTESAVQLFKDNKAIMQEYLKAKPIRSQIQKITKAQQTIVADKTMTPEQREKALDYLNNLVQELMKGVK